MAIRSNILPSPNDADLLTEWTKGHRTVLEVITDAYCVVDVNNHIVDFNVAFTDLCGESYRKVLKTGDFCKLLRTELCPHDCPSSQAMRENKTVRLDELKASSKAFADLQLIVSSAPIVSEEGQTLGALVVMRNVSAESELQKKYDERKKESVIDGLTQLHNKVYTETILLRFLKTSLRDKRPFTVLMCDIDHFKQVNDKFGHQAGDHVLMTVAQLLKSESRDSDIVGRFGGEEFIVGLANSDQQGAQVFAERFRKRVESTPIFFEGKRIPVTVSLGTATYQGTWKAGLAHEEELKACINQADTALYYAKANGRNLACQYESIKKG